MPIVYDLQSFKNRSIKGEHQTSQTVYDLTPKKKPILLAGWVCTIVSVLCIPLLPPVGVAFGFAGFVIGIINLTRGATSAGVWMIVISTLAIFVGSLMGLLFGLALLFGGFR